MEKKIEERFTELVCDLKAKYPDSRYPYSLWRLYQELSDIEEAIDKMHQILDNDHEEDRAYRAQDGWKAQFEEDSDAKSRGGIGLAITLFKNTYLNDSR